MVNVISDPHFRSDARVIEDPKILRSAIFATAMASNIGAFSLTIPSSLAGLLWHQILKQKGIVIRNRDFLGWNLLPVLVLSLVSLAVVFVEVMFIF
jgi:Na+/H+ antiporter NhaD/arsenite permease-like protein